jgi:hypothetical protein
MTSSLRLYLAAIAALCPVVSCAPRSPASLVPIATIAPKGRNGHVMASGGSEGGVFLLGGSLDRDPRVVDTLWNWTGAEWRPVSDQGPENRSLAAGAFDSRRGVLVVYGGNASGSGTLFGDTWEWDGRRWSQRAVRTPGARDHHAMAFDEARAKVVMFGGVGRAGPERGTWTWDGTSWVKVDSSDGPGLLFHHAMAYDSRRQRVVLFGGAVAGTGSTSGRSNETWEWDGTRWERRETAGPVPSGRSHHRMAYDAKRGLTVLFGGGSAGATLNETWTWDGVRWEQHHVVGPAARWSPAMAYDPRRERVVLFSGSGSQAPPPLGTYVDLWEWDGQRWEEMRRPPPQPRDAQ